MSVAAAGRQATSLEDISCLCCPQPRSISLIASIPTRACTSFGSNTGIIDAGEVVSSAPRFPAFFRNRLLMRAPKRNKEIQDATCLSSPKGMGVDVDDMLYAI